MNEGMAPQAVRSPELNRVQEETDIALKELAEVVGHLISRLSKAMGPSQTEADKGQSDPKYYSKLAQDIDLRNGDIRSISSTIRMVLDRLEI